MIYWFCLFTFLFHTPSFGAPAKENVIRTCLSRAALEYNTHLEKIGVPNPARNLLTRIAHELKYNMTFEYIELGRCLKYTKEGEYEGIYPISAQLEAQSILSFPKTSTGAIDPAASLHSATWNVYTLKSKGKEQRLKSIKDIQGPIGVPFDSGMKFKLTKDGVILDESSKNPESLLRQLLTGRVSAIILNDYEFSKAKTSFDKITTRQIQFQFTYIEEPIYFAFSTNFAAKHPELTSKFYAKIVSEKKKDPYRKELQKMQKALE